ncbi:DUF7284 family protein [Halorubrum sp. DTA98]|uniref:DUF7284 family protein n=1 Tax=Halorubrum sp. DTA98 TaxID=3402163 RepID=UPI003AAC3785
MTSTVLDVTLMLLCVSASVVALGGVGSDPLGTGNTGPDADRMSDRLTTETATVTYDPHGSDGESTVHATLAELLVMAMFDDVERGGERNTAEPVGFASSVMAVVSDAFGPRTRIDGRAVRTGSSDEPDGHRSRIGGSRDDVGERRHDGDPTTGAARTDWSVSVGTEPPRGASVTATIVSTPVPEFLTSDHERVRFVVRVW